MTKEEIFYEICSKIVKNKYDNPILFIDNKYFENKEENDILTKSRFIYPPYSVEVPKAIIAFPLNNREDLADIQCNLSSLIFPNEILYNYVFSEDSNYNDLFEIISKSKLSEEKISEIALSLKLSCNIDLFETSYNYTIYKLENSVFDYVEDKTYFDQEKLFDSVKSAINIINEKRNDYMRDLRTAESAIKNLDAEKEKLLSMLSPEDRLLYEIGEYEE